MAWGGGDEQPLTLQTGLGGARAETSGSHLLPLSLSWASAKGSRQRGGKAPPKQPCSEGGIRSIIRIICIHEPEQSANDCR